MAWSFCDYGIGLGVWCSGDVWQSFGAALRTEMSESWRRISYGASSARDVWYALPRRQTELVQIAHGSFGRAVDALLHVAPAFHALVVVTQVPRRHPKTSKNIASHPKTPKTRHPKTTLLQRSRARARRACSPFLKIGFDGGCRAGYLLSLVMVFGFDFGPTVWKWLGRFVNMESAGWECGVAEMRQTCEAALRIELSVPAFVGFLPSRSCVC